MLLSLSFLVLPLLIDSGEEPSDGLVVLRPDAIITAKGELEVGSSVLMRGDKVLAVGKNIPLPPNATVVELEGVLSPGLVDAFTIGGVEMPYEASRAMTPDLLVRDCLRDDDDIWQHRLAAGVTASHIVAQPLATLAGGADEGDPIHLLAGWSFVAGDASELLGKSRQVVGAFSGPFDSREGGPSALPGVLAGLRSELPQVVGLSEHGVVAWVDSAEVAKVLLAMSAKHGFQLNFLCAGDPASYGRQLIAGNEVCGFPVMNEGNFNSRTLETWRRLHAAGVEFAFGSGLGNSWQSADDLRQSAITFARATGDIAAAMRAITSNASALAGYGDKVGVLKPGARADLVLWSAHPLDASAHPKAVMIGGNTVWSAAPVEIKQ